MIRKVMGKMVRIMAHIWSTFVVAATVGLMLLRWAAVPFGYQPIWCMSNSMAPTFHKGSLCYIDTDYDVKSVEKGDIIAFALADGTKVTHRVYDITEDGIITKGDANEVVDIAPISEEQIIGENVFQIEYVGVLFMGFPNKLLLSAVIFALTVWKFLDVLSGLLNSEEAKDEKKEKVW